MSKFEMEVTTETVAAALRKIVDQHWSGTALASDTATVEVGDDGRLVWCLYSRRKQQEDVPEWVCKILMAADEVEKI